MRVRVRVRARAVSPDTVARAICEEDVVGARRVAVPLRDERGDVAPHRADTLRLRVGPHRGHGGAVLACTVHHVRRKEVARSFHVKQVGAHQQRERLPRERQRPLAKRLRVADVALDDRSSLLLELHCAVKDAATHRVLGLPRWWARR